MKILNISDVHNEFVEVYVKLPNNDEGVKIAKEIDVDCYSDTCFIVHVYYENEITNITNMVLSYIVFEGIFHEIRTIQRESLEWKKIKGYIKGYKFATK